MISPGERREVARILRWFASLHGNVAYVTVERMLNLDYSDGFGGGAVTSESVRRLADLIDPMCHVVSEALHTGSFGCEEAGTEFMLSCGHTVIVDGDFPPGYCDECGARVVDDE